MTIKRIIASAIAAPSADNSQPWLYQQEGNHTDIWIDEQRCSSISNSQFVLSGLAVGAVIENMCIQGSIEGYTADVAYLPDPENNPMLAARLTWTKHSDKNASPLADFIFTRHTDRHFPFAGPVDMGSKKILSEQAGTFENISLVWMDAPHLRSLALSVLHRAESMRFRNKELHQELFGNIRWNAGWSGIDKEGLSPASLAVELPARPLFHALKNWGLQSFLNLFGAAYLLGWRSAYLPARLSPALCLLTARKPLDRKTLIIAGRALQRVWLHATQLGLSVQPYAAAGLLTLKTFNLGLHLENDIALLTDDMKSLSPNGHHGLIFFRMGYKHSKVKARSGRRPPTEFLLDKSKT